MEKTTIGTNSLLSWIARLVAAAILGMAAFAKLTSNPDSIKLFTDLGAEPAGRYLVGAAEAITTVLLLLPRTARMGGLLAAGIMLGAIVTHLFKLGVNYGGSPAMFIMAVVTLLAGLLIVRTRRSM